MPGHVLPVAGIRDPSSFLAVWTTVYILRFVFLLFLSADVVQEGRDLSYREEARRVLHAPDCQWHFNGLRRRFQKCVQSRQQVWLAPNTEPHTSNRKLPCIREGKEIMSILDTEHKKNHAIEGTCVCIWRYSWLWMRIQIPATLSFQRGPVRVNQKRNCICSNLIEAGDARVQ